MADSYEALRETAEAAAAEFIGAKAAAKENPNSEALRSEKIAKAFTLRNARAAQRTARPGRIFVDGVKAEPTKEA